MPPIHLHVTQFEKLILKLSSVGVQSCEIAEKLCVSEDVVDEHKRVIREKLHAKNDSQANFFARTFGLIPA